MPIQQMLLGAGGAVATKTYIDDIFSTNVYLGDATNNRSIVNNIDLATEGGLVWLKKRGNSAGWVACDTVTGANKQLETNTSAAQTNLTGTESNYLTAFNTNGFVIGDANKVNEHSGMTHAAWTFRKAPGFFDVVTWTGNGTAGRTISHSLSSVPGMILVKRTDTAADWAVYHRSNGATKIFYLNSTGGIVTDSDPWNDTEPTSSVFTVGDHAMVNASSATYVSYVFAGGKSTAATARSVDFDGSGDYLSAGSSSDFTMGTGDFTVEGWVKFDNATADDGVFQISDTSGGLKSSGNAEGTTIALSHNPGGNAWNIFGGGTAVSSSSTFKRTAGQWYHFAYVRHSSTTTLYINGENIKSFSDSYNYDGTYLAIGGYYSTSYLLDGRISNFRIVKGTALYTSSFKPTNEPLSSVTNTKLLCCNNSSTTGSTVTPGTITANGDPTASTDSPFDDPAGFVFGESGSESVIKTGSYVGNSVNDGPEIFLGWEPQYILIKDADRAEDWILFDSMRGIVDGDSDKILYPNTTAAEAGNNLIKLTPTGFKIVLASDEINYDGAADTYIWMAIRRPDGYVGKPPSLGTDVFAMDTNTGSDPRFISNFPVDFATLKLPDGAQGWYTGARLIQGKNLMIDETSAETTESSQQYDYQNGYYESLSGSYQAWMWKRHAGFDVVTWKSGGSGETHSHGLGRAPEMIWIKNRSSTALWRGGHKGLNGGTNPWTYGFTLNSDSAEFQEVGTFWNGVVPSATSFSTGSAADAGGTSGDNYIAMLFASVDGISKVGYYTGTSSSPSVTITTGFSPRLLIIKRADGTRDWNVFDTVRGIGTGTSDDKRLLLSSNAAQNSGSYVNVTSTGFTVQSVLDVGTNGGKYIYYAHA